MTALKDWTTKEDEMTVVEQIYEQIEIYEKTIRCDAGSATPEMLLDWLKYNKENFLEAEQKQIRKYHKKEN